MREFVMANHGPLQVVTLGLIAFSAIFGGKLLLVQSMASRWWCFGRRQ
jgi:hypothetical protein